ncbi:MAG TPA: hypothetical protein VF632_01145 [Longimicrobium sp.]
MPATVTSNASPARSPKVEIFVDGSNFNLALHQRATRTTFAPSVPFNHAESA